MPDQPFPRMPDMPKFEAISPNPALGIYGEPLGDNDQLAEFFGVSDGVLVRSVRKGSAAEKAGIKAGACYHQGRRFHVAASGDITRTLRGLKGKKSSCVVTVVRNKRKCRSPSRWNRPQWGKIRPTLEVVNC
jgi:serine protease Do